MADGILATPNKISNTESYDADHRVKMVLALIEKSKELTPYDRVKVSFVDLNCFRCGFEHRWGRARFFKTLTT